MIGGAATRIQNTVLSNADAVPSSVRAGFAGFPRVSPGVQGRHVPRFVSNRGGFALWWCVGGVGWD